MDHEVETDRGGAAPSRRPSRTVLGTVALVAAGGIVGAALGISGGASAQTPQPTQSSAPGTTTPEDGMRKGGRGARPGHGPGHMKKGGPGIHGEYVVKKADGGYQTIATQHGEVTAVSPTSISVRSEDGYTATYVVTADTLVNAARDGIATVRTGDTVHVMATRAGDTRTAVHIVDKSRIDAARQQFAPPAQNAA